MNGWSIPARLEEADALAERLGTLPDAPLAMPKQRLEQPVSGILGLLIRRAPAAAGDAGRSGQ
jgi:hypothetical protein